MKMTPADILAKLGFEIPSGGVEISDVDLPFYTEALRLLGATMSVDRIPHADLVELNQHLLKRMGRDREEAAPDVLKMQAALSVVLKLTLGAPIQMQGDTEAPKNKEAT